jgi:hypothetical protein
MCLGNILGALGGCWVIKPQKHLAALLSSEAVKETFETKF